MTKEKNYFYDGLYAYNNKDYEKAINCFNEIIDKFSNTLLRFCINNVITKNAIVIIPAIIWFSVILDANIPIDIAAALTNINQSKKILLY